MEYTIWFRLAPHREWQQAPITLEPLNPYEAELQQHAIQVALKQVGYPFAQAEVREVPQPFDMLERVMHEKLDGTPSYGANPEIWILERNGVDWAYVGSEADAVRVNAGCAELDEEGATYTYHKQEPPAVEVGHGEMPQEGFTLDLGEISLIPNVMASATAKTPTTFSSSFPTRLMCRHCGGENGAHKPLCKQW
jgi:hypothetical protein